MQHYRTVRMLIVVIAATVVFFHEGNSAEPQILPNQVTLSNVEAFKEQMRRDLPVGTAKTSVEGYLTHWNIVHSFYGPAYGPSYGTRFRREFRTLDGVSSFRSICSSGYIWIPTIDFVRYFFDWTPKHRS